MPRTLWIASLGLAFALACGSAAQAAGPDDNVEWNGISHVPTLDRRPLCPLAGETFQVRFQSYRNDLTSARLRISDGTNVSFANASRIATRGAYDVWAAQVPATAATSESYWLELTDGPITDYLSLTGMSHTTPADGGFALDFTTLSHAPVGATLTNSGGAVFKVWAPSASSATVRGEFNGWGAANPMTKVGEYFIAKVAAVNAGQQYKYVFPTRPTNGGYVQDPTARGYTPDGQGGWNSIVRNPFTYAWGDSTWNTPDADSLVIYQLHIGTFAGFNDPVGATSFPSGYRDVAARVGHLRDLGVNAVQLTPVPESDGDITAGYNPVAQFAPKWRYGTADDFKYMVDTFHRNGIAVLLDIVWNHFSSSGNFMWQFASSTQDYFESPDFKTPWGSQAAFGKTGVADYFANSALSWLEEYHVDGFRMDATSYMNTSSHSASGWALMQRLNRDIGQRYAGHFAIAEQLPNNGAVTTAVSSGGAGFSAQYHQKFRDNIRNAIFNMAGNSGDMQSVRDALLGSGATIQGKSALNYVQLHDEAWPTSGGQRMVKTIDTSAPYDDIYAAGRSKLAEGLVLTSQGVPEMLQGDEWLESIDFGADSPTRIDWSKKTTYNFIYRYYQRLMFLRRRLSALRASASTYVFKVDQVNNLNHLVAFRRLDGNGNPVVVVANFGNSDLANYRLGMPASGPWTELINSQDPNFGGAGPLNAGALSTDGTTADGFTQSLTLQIPKMSLIVLAPQGYVDAPAPRVGTHLDLSTPFPNPVHGVSSIAFTLPQRGHVQLTVVDLGGRMVRTLESGSLEAGAHLTSWDGRDVSGALASPGLYFVRLQTPAGTKAVRLTRLD